MLEIAKLIPPSDRRDLLQENTIASAVATHGNYPMKHLMIIWTTYIEPGTNADCGLCFERVLKNFREMQETLVELQKQENLLSLV